MSNSIEYLNACTTPARTATVFNPIRPQYYLKDDVAAAAKASAEAAAKAVQAGLTANPVDKTAKTKDSSSTPDALPEPPAVHVTLSDGAKAALTKKAG